MASSTAVESIEDVGFWISFVLIVVISGVEALASILWTRIWIASDGEHPWEVSISVCGREISRAVIDDAAARAIADEAVMGGGTAGCSVGCSLCHVSPFQTTIDMYGGLSMVTGIAIRRFDPLMSLKGPSELVNNFMELFRRGDGDDDDMHYFENFASLFFRLVDISLGISGLVLTPALPQELWDTLQDVTAPMTLENYLTLFLLWWILGVLLLVAMLPLSSQFRSIQLFGLPGLVAYNIAATASVVLFGLGCWKIDYARRNELAWTPMLSYWIGGASVVNIPCCGISMSHTFGFVGLVFMLMARF